MNHMQLPKVRNTGTRMRVHLKYTTKTKRTKTVITVRPLYKNLPLLNQPLN